MPAQEYRRYAVYYTPPPGALADFGAAWLGWDTAAGQIRPHPDIPGLPAPIAAMTQTPRRYGFHGTLKAPFRLAPTVTFDALDVALAALTAEAPVVPLVGMGPAILDGFVALAPTDVRHVAQGDSSLSDLASYLMRGLDFLRAPLNEAELRRRRAQGLSPRQDAYLRQWGYPFVLEEFRFHMTLTGRLPLHDAQVVRDVLTEQFECLVPDVWEMSHVTLVGEDPDGIFHALKSYPLCG